MTVYIRIYNIRNMRLNEGVEWAVHCCSLLASLPQGAALPGPRLAEFFDLPVHYLAKHLQQLSAAGLVQTRRGPGGGYRLARPAEAISLLEMVEAIDGRAPCFECTEIRRRGPTGAPAAAYRRPCGIARAMLKAEAAWREELGKVSLADIRDLGRAETPAAQLTAAVAWFEGALR